MAEAIGTYDFVELPSEETVTLKGETHCEYTGIFGGGGLSDQNNFDIWVYHPQDSQGDWPADHPPFPVAFFVPGVGLDVWLGGGLGGHFYEEMFEELARAGFIVVAVQPDSNGWGISLRRAALACAMIWAREDTELSSHIGDVMAIVGHSRGGSAVTALTADILAQTNLPSGTALDEWERCAAVSIAPGYNAALDTDVDITDSTSPPHLFLHGGIDEDVQGSGVTSFDNRYSELVAAINGEPELHDEVILWAHDFAHGTWGGNSNPSDTTVAPFFEADNGGLFTGDMEVDLNLPCGVSTIPVTAAVKFESSAILEEPPSISITTPSTAACDGTSVSLTASVSDPDADLYEVLWYVDDVLLGPA